MPIIEDGSDLHSVQQPAATIGDAGCDVDRTCGTYKRTRRATKNHSPSLTRTKQSFSCCTPFRSFRFESASATPSPSLKRQASAFGFQESRAERFHWQSAIKTASRTDKSDRRSLAYRFLLATRILLCDDHVDTTESMALLLRSEGHDVAVCHSALACIVKAREWNPQVALIDIELPDASGYDTARRIRQLPSGKQVFLIAFTGHARATREGVDAGFDAHLTKGADPVLLLEFVARLERGR